MFSSINRGPEEVCACELRFVGLAMLCGFGLSVHAKFVFHFSIDIHCWYPNKSSVSDGYVWNLSVYYCIIYDHKSGNFIGHFFLNTIGFCVVFPTCSDPDLVGCCISFSVSGGRVETANHSMDAQIYGDWTDWTAASLRTKLACLRIGYRMGPPQL